MNLDEHRIDSHKLIYHPERVSCWLKGENVYPIYIEIALFGGCNHRCIFCALDYLRYKPVELNEKPLRRFITEVAEKGVKSIMYAGEGEPLLHKKAADIIEFTKKKGIDVAVTSNATMFNEDVAEKCLGYLSWFRVSLNAGSAETYAKIHRTKKKDFNIVLDNLKNAVKIRNKNRYNCTISAQFLLIGQNCNDATELAMILKDIGIDYFIIKPYSQHPLSENRLGRGLNYDKFVYLERKLKRYENKNLNIVFRKHTIEKLKENKPYEFCLGLPFWAYLDANGDLYACSAFLGNKDFVYGNIYEQKFRDIWEGEKRKSIMEMMHTRWDIRRCREVCRLDEINRYLWSLRNPPSHVNFI